MNGAILASTLISSAPTSVSTVVTMFVVSSMMRPARGLPVAPASWDYEP
ncbi:MAG: hypothetical protein AB7P21_15350 [Lautropia sp.]